jgi:hypothetical protein
MAGTKHPAYWCDHCALCTGYMPQGRGMLVHCRGTSRAAIALSPTKYPSCLVRRLA